MVVAHSRKVVQASRCQSERILPLPDRIAIRSLHTERVRAIRHAIDPTILLLLSAGPQPERLKKRIAESDICEPWFLQINSQREMIELRTLAAVVTGHAS